MRKSNFTLSDIADFEAKLKILKKHLFNNETEMKKCDASLDLLNKKKFSLNKEQQKLNKQIKQFQQLLDYANTMKKTWQLIGR